MSRYHLAQLNFAMLREPLESPGMADFVANLERINALAEASPGYLWRLQDEAGDATAIRPFGAEVLVNLSLWRDVQSLSDYVYKSAHSEMLKRRREWFDKAEQAHMVLWWVPADHRPGVEEAAERLAHLRAHGSSAHAFGFRQAFAAPDALVTQG